MSHRNKHQSKRDLYLPVSFTQQARGLIDQQMWCWGCDVRNPDGNLLLAYGFTKRPAPESRFSSAYTFYPSSTRSITLWGWGIWIAEQEKGSLLLKRAGFKRHYSPIVDYEPSVWCADHMPLEDAPVEPSRWVDAYELLSRLLQWIADYERWLAGTADFTYRERAIEAWPERQRYKGGVPAQQVSSVWSHLADISTAEMLKQ